MLVTKHLWRIHVSGCGGGVTSIRAWTTIKDNNETRYMHIKKKIQHQYNLKTTHMLCV